MLCAWEKISTRRPGNPPGKGLRPGAPPHGPARCSGSSWARHDSGSGAFRVRHVSGSGAAQVTRASAAVLLAGSAALVHCYSTMGSTSPSWNLSCTARTASIAREARTRHEILISDPVISSMLMSFSASASNILAATP